MISTFLPSHANSDSAFCSLLMPGFEQEAGLPQKAAGRDQWSAERSRRVGLSGNILSDKAISRTRKIADMCDRAGAIDVTTQFLRVSFADKNSTVAPGVTFPDFPRCAVIVTDFINCAQSINPSGKMQRCDLLFGIEFDIAPARRSLARTDQLRMTATGAREKQDGCGKT
jgi:hypothetical protein